MIPSQEGGDEHSAFLNAREPGTALEVSSTREGNVHLHCTEDWVWAKREVDSWHVPISLPSQLPKVTQEPCVWMEGAWDQPLQSGLG